MSFNLSGNVLVMVSTLNEELGIKKVLEDMPKDLMVLVVDGGSTDKTINVAKQYRTVVVRQKFGRGKGYGVRTGMEFFLSAKYDVLCMIDGDGSNDPGELRARVQLTIVLRKCARLFCHLICLLCVCFSIVYCY